MWVALKKLSGGFSWVCFVEKCEKFGVRFFCPETQTLEGYVTGSRLGRGVKVTIRKIGTIREIIYGFGQIPLGGSQKREVANFQALWGDILQNLSFGHLKHNHC